MGIEEEIGVEYIDEDDGCGEMKPCPPMACDGSIIETKPVEHYTVSELIVKTVYPNAIIHDKPVPKSKRWVRNKKIWKR